MTNAGMFEDAEEIEKLKKTIDLLETHATIKDFQIQKLREQIKNYRSTRKNRVIIKGEHASS